jgi:hypothetical protein
MLSCTLYGPPTPSAMLVPKFYRLETELDTAIFTVLLVSPSQTLGLLKMTGAQPESVKIQPYIHTIYRNAALYETPVFELEDDIQ